MNKRQLSQLVSFVLTEETLKNTTETGDIAGLPALLTQLSANIGEINQTAATQTQITRGKTARRDERLAGMIDQALEVATAVRAHATGPQLTEVLPEVDVSATDFDRLRLAERPLLAERIYHAASATLPELPGLPALKAAVAAARLALTQPRERITARLAATERLRTLFSETEGLLGRVDCLLYPRRKTSPEFHVRYLATRRAVNASRALEPGSAAPPPAAPANPAAALAPTVKLAA